MQLTFRDFEIAELDGRFYACIKVNNTYLYLYKTMKLSLTAFNDSIESKNSAYCPTREHCVLLVAGFIQVLGE